MNRTCNLTYMKLKSQKKRRMERKKIYLKNGQTSLKFGKRYQAKNDKYKENQISCIMVKPLKLKKKKKKILKAAKEKLHLL